MFNIYTMFLALKKARMVKIDPRQVPTTQYVLRSKIPIISPLGGIPFLPLNAIWKTYFLQTSEGQPGIFF